MIYQYDDDDYEDDDDDDDDDVDDDDNDDDDDDDDDAYLLLSFVIYTVSPVSKVNRALGRAPFTLLLTIGVFMLLYARGSMVMHMMMMIMHDHTVARILAFQTYSHLARHNIIQITSIFVD